MEITVNNQSLTLDESLSLTQLLSAVLHISETGIAIAVNQVVVSKSQWADYTIQPADRIVLIKATQGG